MSLFLVLVGVALGSSSWPHCGATNGQTYHKVCSRTYQDVKDKMDRCTSLDHVVAHLFQYDRFVLIKAKSSSANLILFLLFWRLSCRSHGQPRQGQVSSS
jgi:hypothetical protein